MMDILPNNQNVLDALKNNYAQYTGVGTNNYTPINGNSYIQPLGQSAVMSSLGNTFGSEAITTPQVSKFQQLWQNFQDAPLKDQASAIGSTISGLANAYNAYNSVKMGKDQMALSKEIWNKQYNATKNTTNAALSDRQNARVASNPNAYQSVDSYMKQYGAK